MGGSSLYFSSVAEVAGVTESRHDILMLVQTRVNGSAPDGGVLGECAAYVLDALRRSNHADHVNALRGALGEERLVAHLH